MFEEKLINLGWLVRDRCFNLTCLCVCILFYRQEKNTSRELGDKTLRLTKILYRAFISQRNYWFRGWGNLRILIIFSERPLKVDIMKIGAFQKSPPHVGWGALWKYKNDQCYAFFWEAVFELFQNFLSDSSFLWKKSLWVYF